jgi:hypothetical protein
MTKNNRTAVAVLWILGTAMTAHLLYSALGFSPTDDGFTLAYSRRLLNGQVPHRDFIMIRPALSPILHAPEILLGGPYTYWLSRFVFFLQCACIAWFGTAFIARGLSLALRVGHQCTLAVLSFALCCHSFPAMAWHTIDGLSIAVVGFYVRSRSSTGSAPFAYFVIGLAYLCKQSFVVAAPLALLLFRDWRNWRCLVTAAIPGFVYVAFLILSSGISDGLQQLFSQTGIVKVGIYSYLNSRTILGLAMGAAATSLLESQPLEGWPHKGAIRHALGLALIGVAAVLATVSLASDSLRSSAFALFGMVCGSAIYMTLAHGQTRLAQIRTGLSVALLGWSASLSLGYNSPVLGSGMFVTFLLGVAYCSTPAIERFYRPLLSIIVAVLAVAAFHYARTHHIYRERPASELTASLIDVLPGGRLLRTNSNTHAFLVDLNAAVDKVASQGVHHAIVPGVAGYWVRSEQENPLPIDWAQGTELSTEALRQRVIRSIEDQRHEQMVIVHKVQAADLSSGFAPLDSTNDAYYCIVAYVQTHLEKVGETRFFDIYR